MVHKSRPTRCFRTNGEMEVQIYNDIDMDKSTFGLGSYFRTSTEHVLFGVICSVRGPSGGITRRVLKTSGGFLTVSEIRASLVVPSAPKRPPQSHSPHRPARPPLSSEDVEVGRIRCSLNHLIENVGFRGMVGFRGSEVRSKISHPGQQPSWQAAQAEPIPANRGIIENRYVCGPVFVRWRSSLCFAWFGPILVLVPVD